MSANIEIGGQHRKKRNVSSKSLANLKPPFKKGQSGNPAGVKRGFQSLSAAYKRLMCLSPEEFEKYRPVDWTEKMAKELLQQVVDDGDSRIQAVKEIADRTEGKAKQTIEVTGEDGKNQKEYLIACLIVVARKEGREMSREEALAKIDADLALIASVMDEAKQLALQAGWVESLS